MTKRNINYLEHDLRTSIINDVKTVARYHSRGYKGIQAGHFSIPRQVFCYVDYLGYIAYGGDGSTERSEKFLKKYFPPIYKDYAELIYSMWRHGTIHEYSPKSYYIQGAGKKGGRLCLRWLSNNSDKKINRRVHMNVYAMTGKPDELYLVVNICQLVDDLLIALDSFIADLKNNLSYKGKCELRLNEIAEDQKIETIKRAKSRSKAEKQIRLATNRCAGEIDKLGTVIS